ncbi:transglycosylase SLT domain-containing protein [Wenxinia marina]|uniref:Transglycosylase SLT domain protein n=1 Tax=Wenxinia marina DSM 24838 TaxID=1123501 RepID=A0A0D0Q802_9RHOB|nr:transglycosylase SLT domain-containing protein [Wenxinia marina]KIQ68567.1 Transglycosylase SLT domain protein [Wenxinia marina DSM 24838]GGL66936.1 lytic transglycosylase [Wenxinia marina]
MNVKIALAPLAAAALLSACAPQPVPEDLPTIPEALPAMAWDHRPEADEWTEATLDALQDEGAVLLSTLPADIGTWCPGFASAPREDRAAFWSGLFSALARFESTWNPRAVGGGGRWFGLVQIDPRTARGYGCEAQSGEALRDGAANLECAVRIAARQVANRGTVSRGMLDWGPFHHDGPRGEIRAWVSQQDYCQPERTSAD